MKPVNPAFKAYSGFYNPLHEELVLASFQQPLWKLPLYAVPHYIVSCPMQCSFTDAGVEFYPLYYIHSSFEQFPQTSLCHLKVGFTVNTTRSKSMQFLQPSPSILVDFECHVNQQQQMVSEIVDRFQTQSEFPVKPSQHSPFPDIALEMLFAQSFGLYKIPIHNVGPQACVEIKMDQYNHVYPGCNYTIDMQSNFIPSYMLPKMPISGSMCVFCKGKCIIRQNSTIHDCQCLYTHLPCTSYLPEKFFTVEMSLTHPNRHATAHIAPMHYISAGKSMMYTNPKLPVVEDDPVALFCLHRCSTNLLHEGWAPGQKPPPPCIQDCKLEQNTKLCRSTQLKNPLARLHIIRAVWSYCVEFTSGLVDGRSIETHTFQREVDTGGYHHNNHSSNLHNSLNTRNVWNSSTTSGDSSGYKGGFPTHRLNREQSMIHTETSRQYGNSRLMNVHNNNNRVQQSLVNTSKRLTQQPSKNSAGDASAQNQQVVPNHHHNRQDSMGGGSIPRFLSQSHGKMNGEEDLHTQYPATMDLKVIQPLISTSGQQQRARSSGQHKTNHNNHNNNNYPNQHHRRPSSGVEDLRPMYAKSDDLQNTPNTTSNIITNNAPMQLYIHPNPSSIAPYSYDTNSTTTTVSGINNDNGHVVHKPTTHDTQGMKTTHTHAKHAIASSTPASIMNNSTHGSTPPIPSLASGLPSMEHNQVFPEPIVPIHSSSIPSVSHHSKKDIPTLISGFPEILHPSDAEYNLDSVYNSYNSHQSAGKVRLALNSLKSTQSTKQNALLALSSPTDSSSAANQRLQSPSSEVANQAQTVPLITNHFNLFLAQSAPDANSSSPSPRSPKSPKHALRSFHHPQPSAAPLPTLNPYSTHSSTLPESVEYFIDRCNNGGIYPLSPATMNKYHPLQQMYLSVCSDVHVKMIIPPAKPGTQMAEIFFTCPQITQEATEATFVLYLWPTGTTVDTHACNFFFLLDVSLAMQPVQPHILAYLNAYLNTQCMPQDWINFIIYDEDVHVYSKTVVSAVPRNVANVQQWVGNHKCTCVRNTAVENAVIWTLKHILTTSNRATDSSSVYQIFHITSGISAAGDNFDIAGMVRSHNPLVILNTLVFNPKPHDSSFFAHLSTINGGVLLKVTSICDLGNKLYTLLSANMRVSLNNQVIRTSENITLLEQLPTNQGVWYSNRTGIITGRCRIQPGASAMFIEGCVESGQMESIPIAMYLHEQTAHNYAPNQRTADGTQPHVVNILPFKSNTVPSIMLPHGMEQSPFPTLPITRWFCVNKIHHLDFTLHSKKDTSLAMYVSTLSSIERIPNYWCNLAIFALESKTNKTAVIDALAYLKEQLRVFMLPLEMNDSDKFKPATLAINAQLELKYLYTPHKVEIIQKNGLITSVLVDPLEAVTPPVNDRDKLKKVPVTSSSSIHPVSQTQTESTISAHSSPYKQAFIHSLMRPMLLRLYTSLWFDEKQRSAFSKQHIIYQEPGNRYIQTMRDIVKLRVDCIQSESRSIPFFIQYNYDVTKPKEAIQKALSIGKVMKRKKTSWFACFSRKKEKKPDPETLYKQIQSTYEKFIRTKLDKLASDPTSTQSAFVNTNAKQTQIFPTR